jgi:phospholipase/carboxylesterase
MNPTTASIGDLVCRTFGELSANTGPAPQGLLVLCHGFGAPGTDLVGLGPELARVDRRLGSTLPMVFPEAPIDLGPMYMGGRAWWHIDVGRFAEARSPEDILALAAKEPEGLKAARRKLMKTLEVLMQQTGLPMGRIVLGGFSQGSMLATDVALRAEEAPAALCVYSGALIAKDAWAARAPHRKGLKVLQTHGRQDPILPFMIGEALRDLLTEAGLDVNFTAFNGPHTISGEGVKDLAALCKETLA